MLKFAGWVSGASAQKWRHIVARIRLASASPQCLSGIDFNGSKLIGTVTTGTPRPTKLAVETGATRTIGKVAHNVSAGNRRQNSRRTQKVCSVNAEIRLPFCRHCAHTVARHGQRTVSFLSNGFLASVKEWGVTSCRVTNQITTARI
jgi:hypothetical protein